MPTNGTLKYKQDDGSIVGLNPVGVDAEARALATAEANRAKFGRSKADIGQNARRVLIGMRGHQPVKLRAVQCRAFQHAYSTAGIGNTRLRHCRTSFHSVSLSWGHGSLKRIPAT